MRQRSSFLLRAAFVASILAYAISMLAEPQAIQASPVAMTYTHCCPVPVSEPVAVGDFHQKIKLGVVRNFVLVEKNEPRFIHLVRVGIEVVLVDTGEDHLGGKWLRQIAKIWHLGFGVPPLYCIGHQHISCGSFAGIGYPTIEPKTLIKNWFVIQFNVFGEHPWSLIQYQSLMRGLGADFGFCGKSFGIGGLSLSSLSKKMGVIPVSFHFKDLITRRFGQLVCIGPAFVNFRESPLSSFGCAFRRVSTFASKSRLPDADSTTDQRSYDKQSRKRRHPAIKFELFVLVLFVSFLGILGVTLKLINSVGKQDGIPVVARWIVIGISVFCGQCDFYLILRTLYG
jgi:hypothetical protein